MKLTRNECNMIRVYFQDILQRQIYHFYFYHFTATDNIHKCRKETQQEMKIKKSFFDIDLFLFSLHFSFAVPIQMNTSLLILITDHNSHSLITMGNIFLYKQGNKFLDLYHLLYDFIALPPVQIGCASDSECPTDKACFNGNCVNPCNCGLNAECVVIQHTPLCFCPPGYSGDPRVECQKCKSF